MPDNEKTAVRINASETVYRGRAFSFAVDNITLPNNVTTDIALVRHPGSTGIVPIDDKGRVVMTRQYRHPVADWILEIPAGTHEPGEDPLVCARRELEEETGMRAGTLIELVSVHILPAYTDELIRVYLAMDLTPTAQNLDEDEIISVETYSMDEVMKMIDDGGITDALTILSIQHARRYLKRHKR